MNKLEDSILPFMVGIKAAEEKRKSFLKRSSPFHSLYTRKKGKEYKEIKCTSLNDISYKNKIEMCDVLKLDCEGAEFEILYNTPIEYLEKIQEIQMEYHIFLNSERYTIRCLKGFLKNEFNITKFKPASDYSGIIWFKQIKN